MARGETVPVVGYLGSLPEFYPGLFRQSLGELGYVEGQNIAIEERFANGTSSDQFHELAAELVRLQVAVIVALSEAAARAAKEATNTIPIVMILGGDPVGTKRVGRGSRRVGLVTNLTRPGENVTGLAPRIPQLNRRRLLLLKRAFPGIARVGVLWDAGSLDTTAAFDQLQAAAPALQLAIQSLAVREPGDFDAAFAAATREAPDALLVLGGALTTGQRARIVEFAARKQLPAMYGHRQFVEAGGLMSYGVDQFTLNARAAYYVDKVLKGTRTDTLPVERPMRFELVMNRKASQALGLRIGRDLLVEVTQMVE